MSGQEKAAPAAAGRGLEDDRIAHGFGHFQRLFGGLDDSLRSGQDRNARLLHGGAGVLLEAHGFDDGRFGPDESDPAGFADIGETGVFAEEAVAGVDGIDVGNFSGADDRRDVEVAAGALGGADADGLIGKANVERVAIRFRVDSDGADTEFLARADDAERDLAPIGDENLLEHLSGGGR